MPQPELASTHQASFSQKLRILFSTLHSAQVPGQE